MAPEAGLDDFLLGDGAEEGTSGIGAGEEEIVESASEELILLQLEQREESAIGELDGAEVIDEGEAVGHVFDEGLIAGEIAVVEGSE